MQTVTAILENYRNARYRFYRSRTQVGTLNKLLLALGMAVLTGLMAQVRISLPWSPVPITAQTIAVLLAGVLLGHTWGGISMAIYIVLGVSGVPWFTGWASGFAHLAGPTGGYIWGFILAALFIGYMADRYVRARSFTSLFVLMLLADFVLIFGPGLAQLYLWLNLVKGSAIDLPGLLYMGMLPFIAGDVTKAAFTAMLGTALMPKEPYNNESDADKWQNRRLP
jgi:biotin transport system substrate-specific component